MYYLKENGVIDKQSNPENIEQILDLIHRIGLQSATAIDTPPITARELRDLSHELSSTMSTLAANATALLPSFESIWTQITDVAKVNKISIEEVLGILTVHTGSVLSGSVNTANALGKTSITLLDDALLSDYRETLTDLQEKGPGNYLKENMGPFVENARSHFDFDRTTITQNLLNNTSRLVKKLAGSLKRN